MAFLPHIELPKKEETEQFAEGDFHSVLKKHGYKADDNKRTVYTHPDLGWGVHLGTNYGWKHKEHDADGGGHLGRGVSPGSLDRHLAAMHDTQHAEAPVAIHGQGVMTPPIQYLETTTSKPNKRMKKDISAEEVSSKVPGNEQQKPEQYSEQPSLNNYISPFGAIVR